MQESHHAFNRAKKKHPTTENLTKFKRNLTKIKKKCAKFQKTVKENKKQS